MSNSERDREKVIEFISLHDGSQTKAAAAIGFHASSLSGVIHGRWGVSKRLMDAIETEMMSMRQRKFDRIYRELTTTSKKVYEAVPIGEWWSQFKIIGELERTGVGMSPRAVEACLNQLREAGLITRNADKDYQREAIEPNGTTEHHEDDDTVSQPNPDVPAPPPVSEPPLTIPVLNKPKTALDILAELSERATGLEIQAINLTNDFRTFRGDIETAALTIQELMEAEGKELIELRQLREMMRKFMG